MLNIFCSGPKCPPSKPFGPNFLRTFLTVTPDAHRGQLSVPLYRARKRHINFEHINFVKVGTTLGQPAGQLDGKVYSSCVSRRTHKLFGPVNPGTTSRLSQGHLDVNQSKKFMFMCPFSPGL